MVVLLSVGSVPLNKMYAWPLKIHHRNRQSSPIFEFWLFICSIDRVLIADLRNIWFVGLELATLACTLLKN